MQKEMDLYGFFNRCVMVFGQKGKGEEIKTLLYCFVDNK